MNPRKYMITSIDDFIDKNENIDNDFIITLKQTIDEIGTNYCLTASMRLSEKLPRCDYKAGFFIYDKPLRDEYKHIFKSGYQVKISHETYLLIKSIVKFRVTMSNVEDYIFYHGWNEITIGGKIHILDTTVRGFEECNLMKEKIPYFDKTKKFIILDKNDSFCKRYIYDENIKNI